MENSPWRDEWFPAACLPHPHLALGPQDAPTQGTSFVCSGGGLASPKTGKLVGAVLALLKASIWVDTIHLLGALYSAGRRAGGPSGPDRLLTEDRRVDF